MNATADIILIRVSWPDKVLSPNARPHYMALSRAKKKARQEAYYEARLRGAEKLRPADRYAIHVTAYPKVRRNRDEDNFIASLKAAFDGIADAMGVDDSLFAAPTIEWGEPQANAAVLIEVRALPGDKS